MSDAASTRPSQAQVDEPTVWLDSSQADSNRHLLVVVPDDVAERRPVGPHPLWQRAIKRLVDVVGSVVLIAVLLPIGAIISAAIAIESPGPVVFVQRRVGRKGRTFPLVKFRTMVHDSDEVLEEALANDEALRQEWEQWRKLRDDPRVTRVGRFLRRFSLDELPQILNVLIGNMSLVGPRPVMEDELRYFGALADPVLSVRPGLTGKWAVSGRSEISYGERVRLEYEYATTWTLLGDTGIILRTVPAVFRGHGAY